jgi:S1-C subfamily serine protease
VPTGGDVIVELEGTEITSSAELQSAVEAKRPGETVTITVVRDGDRETLEVTLGERPENP